MAMNSKVSDLPYRPNVGLCIINHQGKIFSGKRLDMPSDAWQMPQGGIDAGETPAAAALREMTEETGIVPDHVKWLAETRDWITYDLPEELIGRFWGGKYRGQKQKWYAYQFIGQDSDIEIETAHPEFSAWEWKSKNELIDAIVPFKKEIYQKVFLEFREFLN